MGIISCAYRHQQTDCSGGGLGMWRRLYEMKIFVHRKLWKIFIFIAYFHFPNESNGISLYTLVVVGVSMRIAKTISAVDVRGWLTGWLAGCPSHSGRGTLSANQWVELIRLPENSICVLSCVCLMTTLVVAIFQFNAKRKVRIVFDLVAIWWTESINTVVEAIVARELLNRRLPWTLFDIVCLSVCLCCWFKFKCKRRRNPRQRGNPE